MSDTEHTKPGITILKGLAWGHRRATDPLYAASKAFTARNPSIHIAWEDRPLSGFVNEEMAEVVGRYDLISFDHPFSGTVVLENLFVPLDRHLPQFLGEKNLSSYAGPTLVSYRYKDQIIGAPIDAAVMHAIYRADLLKDLNEAVPQSWGDVISLGRRLSMTGKYLSAAFASPHGFLTFASLCANLGSPLPDDPRDGPVLDAAVASQALDALRELFSLVPADALSWDSIAMHDAMVANDDLVFCPCEFGYATYGESDQRRPLSFGHFTGLQKPYFKGAILGGVGLGVPVASMNVDSALRFVEFALQPQTQEKLFGLNHGQPAVASAWNDKQLDERFNGYFSSTKSTIEGAAIRPRFPGYIRAQAAAGLIIEDFLRDHKPISQTIKALTEALGPTAVVA